MGWVPRGPDLTIGASLGPHCLSAPSPASVSPRHGRRQACGPGPKGALGSHLRGRPRCPSPGGLVPGALLRRALSSTWGCSSGRGVEGPGRQGNGGGASSESANIHEPRESSGSAKPSHAPQQRLLGPAGGRAGWRPTRLGGFARVPPRTRGSAPRAGREAGEVRRCRDGGAQAGQVSASAKVV